MEKTIEIPFGAKDSELNGWEYTIPEDMEAEIKDGKIIVKQKENEDERIRQELIEYLIHRTDVTAFVNETNDCKRYIDYLERQKEQKPTAEEVLIRAGLKPFKDGNQWCVLVGDNIQEGVCGFGDTIEDALYEFLKEVCEQQKPTGWEWPNLSNCIRNCKKCHGKCFYRKEPYEEQKPASTVESKFKSGDRIRFNGFGSNEYTIQMVGNGYYVNSEGGRMDMSYTDANFVLIENAQKEQKPIKVYDNMDDLIADAMIDEINESDMLDRDKHNRVYWITKHRQKPAEWSEEYRKEDLRTRFAFYTYKDEDSVLYLSNVFVEETSRNKGFGTKILQAAEMVAQTIGALTIRLKVKQNTSANDWYRRHGYGYLVFEDGYDWLEKNLEYLKPKQEWSEEDKLHLNNAILSAEKEWGSDSCTSRWLKSLPDNYKKCNSHWKPSEEQMWALDVALENFYHQSDRSALESLKTDLQKLL